MSFIDRLLGAAPGIAAQGIQAQRFGAEKRQKDLEAADDRNRAIQRDALQSMLLQNRDQRDAATSTAQQGLLGAQSDFYRTRNEPKPVAAPVHRRALKTDKTGRVRSVDEETGRDEDGNPVYERVPGAVGAGTGAGGGAAGGPGTPKAPPRATQSEQQSYTLARRGEEANEALGKLDEQHVNPGVVQRFFGNHDVTNGLASPDTHHFQQAATNFVMSVLRKDSGASISSSEWNQAYKVWLPRPGDDPAMLATKAQNRATAIDAIKKTSGAMMNFATEGQAQATPQQQDWDALAQQYGAEETERQIGPRP